jgi:hypothetical protein
MLFTPQGMPKTPEIQQQIANDARLARQISNRFHSPIKKGNKEGNRRLHKPLERTSKNAAPRRLEFGDMKEGQAWQEGSSRASRRLAVGVSKVAAEAPAHWLIVSDSEGEGARLMTRRTIGRGGNPKKLEQETSFTFQDTSRRPSGR